MKSDFAKTWVSFFCTSLAIEDTKGNIYHGRTLEFSTTALTSYVCFFPKGSVFSSALSPTTPLMGYSSKYEMLGIGMLVDQSKPDSDKQLLEGVNSQGLSFSLNMKADSEFNKQDHLDWSKVLPFDALGHWALASFENIAQLEQALKTQEFCSRELEQVGGASTPFHFAFYDTTGDCLVVEINYGELCVYHNPTRVMTNGPELPWHLTNLNNYTHLTNLDSDKARLGNIDIHQPDSGISQGALPSSDTSVGRFIRAVYYSSFVLKQDTPNKALIELSHIMNKFDRPKNMSVQAFSQTVSAYEKGPVCEFTLWTTLTDLKNQSMLVRSYNSFNYQSYNLKDFLNDNKIVSIPID